ncbi:MAG: SDR family oxidoreductase [Bryobacteraceae bacterium]|nr:SDR family oxidoreductase [Bryobacteraceae bacterium]
MADFFEDKVAVVTGASRGLGRAMAVALAAKGCRVALVGRDAAKLDETAKECGPGAAIFPCDLTQEEEVLRLESRVSEILGRVQILVNNAGVNLRKRLVDFSLDEWRYVIDSNLTSAFLVSRAFVPHMTGTGYGRILFLTSTMSHVSLPERAAYSASKSGLLGLVRALALELSREGITVNGISPGPFATEMNTALLEDPKKNADFLSRVPVGVWGDPKDIGALAVYLCSPEAKFITGTDIAIDGGWLAQ